MLDFFIIEEIKRRERSERPAEDRPAVELPLPQPPEPSHHDEGPSGPSRDRGVVIIDFLG